MVRPAGPGVPLRALDRIRPGCKAEATYADQSLTPTGALIETIGCRYGDPDGGNHLELKAIETRIDGSQPLEHVTTWVSAEAIDAALDEARQVLGDRVVRIVFTTGGEGGDAGAGESAVIEGAPVSMTVVGEETDVLTGGRCHPELTRTGMPVGTPAEHQQTTLVVNSCALDEEGGFPPPFEIATVTGQQVVDTLSAAVPGTDVTQGTTRASTFNISLNAQTGELELGGLSNDMTLIRQTPLR